MSGAELEQSRKRSARDPSLALRALTGSQLKGLEDFLYVKMKARQ